MEKVKRFLHFISIAEDAYSIISWFIHAGIGAGMIWLFRTLGQPMTLIGGAILGIAITAFVLLGIYVVKLILAFRKHDKKIRFYENRDELPPLPEELSKAQEIWLQWRVGSSAKSLSHKIWDNPNLKCLVTHSPLSKKGQPNYLRAHLASFPNVTLKEMYEDIYSATRQAQPHVEVRWFNGYLGDSLIIADPHGNNKQGWIRIEISTPFSRADDRPNIRIEEKEYPDLFARIIKNYETAFDKGDIPPPQYRQQTSTTG